MRYFTHITTSLSAVVLLGDAIPVNVDTTSTLAVSGLLLGSVLPDIDESRSWIGRRIPGLSSIAKTLFGGHRGLTHSGLILILMIAGTTHFSNEFLLGLFLGVILHILADFFSVGGIPLLYPFSKKRSQIALYRTGTWSEGVILVAGAAVLVNHLLPLF
ncbi:metal-dependent hydrolase [Salipaludibacillus aurantiacus]|uniref:Inner membrane protein n=1 Tax=Salipaludibacillus aurantiacus TaxID=1601833 RepID=A0A1H9WUA8_9BACI|nr:metal-dependent hydrolase [Salipaludibacillus aurantiacus]SES36963.1 inner membrane protein [Salipaludibacillus aurantiacus]